MENHKEKLNCDNISSNINDKPISPPLFTTMAQKSLLFNQDNCPDFLDNINDGTSCLSPVNNLPAFLTDEK